MSSSAVRVARGSLILVVGGALKIPVGLVTLAYIARILSLTEMGLVVGFQILAGVFRLIADPGLSSAMATFSAEGIGRGLNVGGLIKKITLIGFAFASIVSFVFLLVGSTALRLVFKTDVSIDLLWILCIYVLLDCFLPYLDGPLVGFSDFKSLKLVDVSSYVVGQLAAVAMVGLHWGVRGVFMGGILGCALYLVQAFLAIRRNLRPYYSYPSPVPTSGELFRFSLPVYVSGFIQYASEWFDRFFILAFFPIEQLAVYSVAYSIYGAAMRLSGTVSEVSLPHFAQKFGRSGKRVLQLETKDAARYVSLIFTPILLGLAAIPGAAISLIAGPSYANGGVVLGVFCAFGAMTLAGSGFEQVFYVLKKTKVYAIAALAATAGVALLSLVLAGPLGILGMAFAKSTAFLIVFVLELWFLWIYLQVKLDASVLGKILLSGLAMAALVCTVQQVYHGIEFLGVYVGIGVVSYLALIRQMRVLRKRDFDVTREFLGPRLRPVVDFAERLARPTR
ncbi:oligosaccharide flippase family protein [Candidatus Bathyarchaeota archaeon]|nr:oligosaccharide flippase family protein [Candidatus Bathyarchaeota archaeon]